MSLTLSDEEVATCVGYMANVFPSQMSPRTAAVEALWARLTSHKPGQPEVRARPSHVRLTCANGKEEVLVPVAMMAVYIHLADQACTVSWDRAAVRVTESPDEIARMVGVGDE